MDIRLLWVVAVIILVIAAIITFSISGTRDQAPHERPTPHALDQGNG